MIVKFRDFLDEKWSFGGHVEKKKKGKRKSKALGTCLKPLFCMASHNCKLKNTEGKKRDPRHSKNQLKSLYSAQLVTVKFLTRSYDYTNRKA